MTAFIALIGSAALQGRYMLARELMDESRESQVMAKQYRAARPNLTGLDLINVAAVMVRDHAAQE